MRRGFNTTTFIKPGREANTVDSKPYAIPYDGEMTVQVYRKDLYDAKGLKPAETLEQFVENAKALCTIPSNRLWGAALRGFAGAGQNMYIYPSTSVSYGGNLDERRQRSRATARKSVRALLDWYVDTLTKYAATSGRKLELARHRRRLRARHPRRLYRCPFFGGGPQTIPRSRR